MDKTWDDALDEIMKETEKMSPDEIRAAVKNIRNPEFAEIMREANDFYCSLTSEEAIIKESEE